MYFHCDDQAYGPLAGLFRKISIQEIMHIEKCAERILLLGGEVEMKVSHEVEKIHDVTEMLKKFAEMERDSIQNYNNWAMECAQNADSVSKQVFETLVADEEGHFDNYDDEINNLKKFGDNYLPYRLWKQVSQEIPENRTKNLRSILCPLYTISRLTVQLSY